MQGIQPRPLSNQELIKYAAMLLDKPEGMPIAWQKEVIRRLTVIDPQDAYPYPQAGQRDLFI
jgi:hypothetical protein